uniref:Uncharacterized protein n=1 Tax=Anguilla anguilla TaxID=7936 RepID=A0A0E9QPQ0_ANGAN
MNTARRFDLLTQVSRSRCLQNKPEQKLTLLMLL